jgi:hypothetical protein
MDLLVALGISIGVLIAGWVYVALAMPDLHLVVWAGVIAWGTFYATGGGMAGLQKAIASNLSGNLWAAVALLVFAKVGGGNVAVLAALVGVISLVMCVQAKVAILSFIPGAFLGAGTWVGASGGGLDAPNLMICVSLVAGAVLGYASEVVGKKMAGAS